MSIDRRSFMAGSISALASSRLLAAKRPYTRRLIDVCSGRALPGVRIRAKNLTTGKKWRLKTTTDGTWDYPALLESIQSPEGEEVEILVRPASVQGVPYFGIRTLTRLWPLDIGGRNNRQTFRLSLVPMAMPFGAESPDDPSLDDAWPTFLAETLFGQDRRPEEADDKTAQGATLAWQTKKILMLFGDSLENSEFDFLLEIVPEAVDLLSAGTIRAVDGGVWPASETPDLADDVPTEAILFEANDDYPRPSVLPRYNSINPHRIEAVKITLDNLTLSNFFRKGNGSPEQLAMARHLVQRCVAGALGFNATMALPNRTLLDATALTDGSITRTGIRPEDVLLGRILYGSGWLLPGARMSKDKTSIINGR